MQILVKGADSEPRANGIVSHRCVDLSLVGLWTALHRWRRALCLVPTTHTRSSILGFRSFCLLTTTRVMRLAQALRRSIKGDKEKQQNASIAQKSAVAIVPPKKVCRVLRAWTAPPTVAPSMRRQTVF